MPVTYPDKLLRPAVESLLLCLCTAALANPVPPASCRLLPYVNGTPMFGTMRDDCCDGQAFLYPGPMSSVVAGTTPDPGPVSCKLTYMVQLQIGIWRCAPVGTLQAPPTKEEWNASTLQLLDDRATLRDAICCFIKDWTPKTVSVGTIETINEGPEGKCIGTAATLTVGLGRAIG